MRVYAYDLDGSLLLLQTDDRSAARLDNGELDMGDVVFSARIIDPAELFVCDEDGSPLNFIM